MKLSVSRIKLFKACRRAYQLKYIYGLEPVQKAEALAVGESYHEKLEQLYETGEVDISDFSKESAMALAYKKYVYPFFKVKAVEKWEKIDLPDGNIMIGRVDGISDDGKLVEHKTTSISPLEYQYNLQWDEQISAYMLMTGMRSIYYTVCVKPTIRQKKNESDEEFFWRMVEWYDEDSINKIAFFEVSRTDEEISQYKTELQDMSYEITNAMALNRFYKNTSYCKCWGRDCEYKSVCLNYDPSLEYVEFTRREEED